METSSRPAIPAPLSLFAPLHAEGSVASSRGQYGRKRSDTRKLLIELTMREVAKVGPGAFRTRAICTELGVAHPVVQYHFGNRDGLIAEAAQVLYARYVDLLWEAVEAAPRTPLERLRSFLHTGLHLSIEMRGWGAVLNYYPSYSSAMAVLVAKHLQERHTRLYERNLAMIAQLVADVWADRITDGAPPLVEAQVPDGDGPPAVLELRPELAAIAGMLFSLHGLTVWRAGHVPTVEGSESEVERFADQLAAAHIENLIALIAASHPTVR